MINIVVLDITLKGGIERFVANLASGLVKRGRQVRIISLLKTHDKPLFQVEFDLPVLYMSNLKFDRFYKVSTLYSCFGVLGLSKADTERESVFLCTHPITAIFLRLIGFDMGRVVTSEHSAYESHNWLIRKLRLWAYKDVKNIVAQTKHGMSKFFDDGLIATTIYNQVSDLPNSGQWRINKPSDFRCLVVARIEPVKNLDLVLHIARRAKDLNLDIKFDIVGDGTAKKELQQLAKSLDLEGQVQFYDATPNVGQFYKSASVYLITSYTESFSMTMIEALSFGVPVISNQSLVGPSEILTHEEDGYLCLDNDLESFWACLLAYYESAEKNYIRSRALCSGLKFKEKDIISQWLNVL